MFLLKHITDEFNYIGLKRKCLKIVIRTLMLRMMIAMMLGDDDGDANVSYGL